MRSTDLKKLLKSGRDALVDPRKWEDPFENFLLDRAEALGTDGEHISLTSLADDWYGQCWSLRADTDTMWLIYSPDAGRPGVKAKSTIGRIFENLRRVPSTAPWLQYFVGRVDYRGEAEIQDLMGKVTFADLAQGEAFARFLCLKREAFAHESEVRLLFCDVAPAGVFELPLDATKFSMRSCSIRA